MLPIPAMRMRAGRAAGRGAPLPAAAARPPGARRRTGGPAAAAGPDRRRGPPPARPQTRKLPSRSCSIDSTARGLAVEHQVEDVAPGPRPEEDAVALLEQPAADAELLDRPVDLHRAGASPARSRRLLERADLSQHAVHPHELRPGRSASVRSSSSRARSSDAAISRFSSSVSVRIRSESISSISVPSKKSPGLSGAMVGKS